MDAIQFTFKNRNTHIIKRETIYSETKFVGNCEFMEEGILSTKNLHLLELIL